ncbi:MAG: hypothetical protein QOE90_2965 [Thermoplasmata archaeon]|jgi:hypothetical protein|nr:hypothetical protein [Thermoplasmata archaeon]
MKTAIVLSCLLVLPLLVIIAPPAAAVCDHSTCVGNSGTCKNGAVCVLNSGTCDDSICVSNSGTCIDDATCILNSGSSIAFGTLFATSHGRACQSNTALVLTRTDAHWTLSEYFVSDPTIATPCSSASGLTLFRTYSDADSTFTSDNGNVQITRATQESQGLTYESTSLFYGPGASSAANNVHVEQAFTTNSVPTWQATGDLATQPTAGVVPLDVGSGLA